MNLEKFNETMDVAKANVLAGSSTNEVREVFFKYGVLVTDEILDDFIQGANAYWDNV